MNASCFILADAFDRMVTPDSAPTDTKRILWQLGLAILVVIAIQVLASIGYFLWHMARPGLMKLSNNNYRFVTLGGDAIFFVAWIPAIAWCVNVFQDSFRNSPNARTWLFTIIAVFAATAVQLLLPKIFAFTRNWAQLEWVQRRFVYQLLWAFVLLVFFIHVINTRHAVRATLGFFRDLVR